MAETFSVLELSHKFIAEHVKPGGFCIDATAGRGFDTAFLCECVGPGGQVLAFDIQQEAVDSTNGLLRERGLSARVVLDSHANLARYAKPETVDCIAFNFGWLPGGSHEINTRAESSVAAVEAGLALLKPLGIMSLSIYYGRNTGFEERDALLALCERIDPKVYTVIVSRFANRSNNPPIPVFIIKDS